MEREATDRAKENTSYTTSRLYTPTANSRHQRAALVGSKAGDMSGQRLDLGKHTLYQDAALVTLLDSECRARLIYSSQVPVAGRGRNQADTSGSSPTRRRSFAP
jgi:hypothetical protein